MRVEMTPAAAFTDEKTPSGLPVKRAFILSVNEAVEGRVLDGGPEQVYVNPTGSSLHWGPFESVEIAARRALVNMAKSASTAVKRALNPEAPKKVKTAAPAIDMQALKAEIMRELLASMTGATVEDVELEAEDVEEAVETVEA